MGDDERGDKLNEVLQQKAQQSWVPPTCLGWLRLVRGEVEEACDRFEEAARRKDFYISAHRIDSPVPIPSHPRLDALRDRLGLVP